MFLHWFMEKYVPWYIHGTVATWNQHELTSLSLSLWFAEAKPVWRIGGVLDHSQRMWEAPRIPFLRRSSREDVKGLLVFSVLKTDSGFEWGTSYAHDLILHKHQADSDPQFDLNLGDKFKGLDANASRHACVQSKGTSPTTDESKYGQAWCSQLFLQTVLSWSKRYTNDISTAPC